MRKNWILPPKPGRLLMFVGLLAVVWLGDQWYRWWRPTVELRTTHYFIRSSATRAQTEEVGRKVEALHDAYFEFFRELIPAGASNGPLKLNLFASRAEFRRCHRWLTWEEAFYREPYCHAYFPSDETSPWQWMIHEAVHQMNREVARFELAQWAEEGVAEYFSTSRFAGDRLRLGVTDPNTYPLWWFEDQKFTGDMDGDLASGALIPLRALMSGQGGPSLNKAFNAYYLHWWSLVKFLIDDDHGRRHAAFLRVLRQGATLESFEKEIGPVEQVQSEWYAFFLRQK
jgi:hypothetical protein